MIRREDGNDWLLIPQIEHARLAGDIAACWGNEQIDALPCSEPLVAAVRHHDDGWREWDDAPHIDAANGIPRSFLEMRMGDATEIWTRSIATCGKLGPLSGIWVSKHFYWLGEQALESRSDEPEDLQAIEAFLAEQERLQRHWRSLAGQPSDELTEGGFHGVQFFDRLSLWLCCAPRTEPLEIDFPGFGPIRFTPMRDDRIVLAPYPLSRNSLELPVTAKRIEENRFANDGELQSALRIAPVEQLAWTLPAS